MSKYNFTKRTIDNLPLPMQGKSVDYYDEIQRNLFVRVTCAGSRTFYVRRKISGISERIFIGRYPDISVEQARRSAAAIMGQIAMGSNPQESIRAAREEATIGELFTNYIEQYARGRCLRAKDMERDFERYVKDWRERKYSSVKKSDVQTRFNDVFREHGPGAANHILILMRAAINWNLRHGFIEGANTWAGLRCYKIQARERFLKPNEMEAFFSAVGRITDDTIRDFIAISLFTGARKSNVLGMRWDQVDFDLAIWRIPLTKNKDSQTVPLTKPAMTILKRRRLALNKKSPWVFPGKDPNLHLVDPKRSWQTLLRKAGISDLRMHDLRRTLASYMAIDNQSLSIIAKALGHKSTVSTQIYSRLTNDPVRQAMEQAQERMFVAANTDAQRDVSDDRLDETERVENHG